MKRRILLGLAFIIFCFALGGTFIFKSISDVTKNIEEISMLQKVELLRETLETSIQVVQADLQKRSYVNPGKIESIKKAADECELCHESKLTKKRLDYIRHKVDDYSQLVKQAQALSHDPQLFEAKNNQAHTYGDELLHNVSGLSLAPADIVAERIDTINQEMTQARYIIIASIVLGPLFIIISAVYFLRKFTTSIDTLVTATQKISPENLDYRITVPLKDEFKSLADAFNQMIQSLKEKKQDLTSLQKLYQTVFESAGEAICIVDTAEDNFARIVSVNKAASDIYEYSIEELTGKNCLDLSPEEEKEKFLENMQTIIAGNWLRFQATRCHKDGSTFLADISAGPLILDDHHYILSFARDITKKVQAEQELLRANQMAIAGQMAVGIAHEIKNPLAGIKASIEVLADDLELETADQDLLGRVINEIRRMERLLKDLLSYARPPKPQLDQANINQLLEQTIKNVEISAAKTAGKQISFKRDFITKPLLLEIDSSQLQQVFLNILLNAIDAISAIGKITIKTEQDQNQTTVTIIDDGKGMDSSTSEKVFTPFFTTKSKGSGLGLSICRRLIEQHGGSINVSSQLMLGTIFTIILPHKHHRPEGE